MILLIAASTSDTYPQAYNADQIINITSEEYTPTEYVYVLNFGYNGYLVQQYQSAATFATAELAVAAAVTLLQSLPLLTILSTVNLVESITLT